MELKPTLVVLYASQTGNAQDVAERIGREAERLQLDATIISMDAYDPSALSNEKTVIFVTSTTGQGDPPDSMKNFWKYLLRRSLSRTWLEGLNYAVFGLGDSGYQQYNVVAKKLDKRLSDLGGKQIISKGLGDDQHPSGYEASLDPWLSSLWEALGAIYCIHLNLTALTSDNIKLDSPKYTIIYSDRQSHNPEGKQGANEDLVSTLTMLDAADGLSRSLEATMLSFGPKNPYMARMICSKNLTSNLEDRDVRHIEFDLGKSGISYTTGDVLAVMPSQKESDINAFISRCNLDPDAHILIRATKASHTGETFGLTKPVTIKSVVRNLMDIASASPRRYFFEVMSHFAVVEHEKEKLRYFGTPEGRDDLYQYNQRERRTVLEVLEDFPSVQLPFEWLLQLVPRLQPRLFSISSSSLVHPNEVHITVAVQKWKTPLKRLRHGLCSTWLSGLDPQKGDLFVPVWIKEGGLKPPDASIPLLLIGPGTGCAPFRAFIQDRVALSLSQKVAPVMFFFGCRHENEDFLYKDFWMTQTKDCGLLSEEFGGGFYVAFSRDQPNKVYVQHKIQEQSSNVWRMLQSACAVYVAGSANKMPADVASALEDVISHEGSVSKEAARDWLNKLKRVGRYQVEAWQ